MIAEQKRLAHLHAPYCMHQGGVVWTLRAARMLPTAVPARMLLMKLIGEPTTEQFKPMVTFESTQYILNEEPISNDSSINYLKSITF